MNHKRVPILTLFTILCSLAVSITASAQTDLTYTIVDTDQTWCFSDEEAIECGEIFVGQDAQYAGLQPAYQDNGDGTITDLNTGLMWIQDQGDKTTYTDAIELLEAYSFAGYDDWRLPTVKELLSLALYSGSSTDDGVVPFFDTDYFVYRDGIESGGNRVVDTQWLTSNIYTSTVYGDSSCFFGFNFSDGRIKCYGLEGFNPSGGYFAQFVRGSDNYGENNFVDNGDSTITDEATGLTWMQNDNGAGLLWDDALSYCETLSLGGSDDWRLPNVKELHSIVDYSRSPDATNSPAIDPIFNTTEIVNEGGQADYPFFWSSTTLIGFTFPDDVLSANYVAFGRALGYDEEQGGWVDVHGAGALRSDPIIGDPDDYPTGNGPQLDNIRVYNYVRCVSGGVADPSIGDDPDTLELVSEEALIQSEPQDTQLEVQGEPDLAAAAEQLGVTEDALLEAMGEPGEGPDFETAAEQLGVAVEALEEALGSL